MKQWFVRPISIRSFSPADIGQALADFANRHHLAPSEFFSVGQPISNSAGYTVTVVYYAEQETE